MTRLLAAELLKLRSTRAPLFLGVAWLVVSAGIVVANFWFTSELDLELVDEQEFFVRSIFAFIGLLLAPIIGIGVATTDMRHRIMGATLLNEPRRDRVIAAKFLTAAVAGALAGLLVMAGSIAVGALLLLSRGVEFGMSATDIVSTIAAGGVFGAVMCLFGFGIGALVMSQTAAIVLTLGFLLIVQSILAVVLAGDAYKWIPGTLAISASELWGPADPDNIDEIFSATLSILILFGYGVALSALGALRLRSTDIT